MGEKASEGLNKKVERTHGYLYTCKYPLANKTLTKPTTRGV